jgi:hypothetical protein
MARSREQSNFLVLLGITSPVSCGFRLKYEQTYRRSQKDSMPFTRFEI